MSFLLQKEFDIDRIVAAASLALYGGTYDLNLEEENNYHDFIRIMANLGWPAFLDGDIDFHVEIIKLYKEDSLTGIYSAIFNHYNSVYIEELQTQLEESRIIDKLRLPLFKEALLLYNLGYYYGCITIMLSQIVGIIKDIETFLSSFGIKYDDNNNKLLNSRYHISDRSEKGRIVAALLEGKNCNDLQGEYLYLIGYFRTKIFSNKLDESDMLKHVNRNMIFHSEQLTFGTKEQALKIILCIDSLCWLADVLYQQYFLK